MRFIDEATIARVLSMQDLIPAMRQTMIDFSRGQIDQPPRRMSAVQPHGGFSEACLLQARRLWAPNSSHSIQITTKKISLQ